MRRLAVLLTIAFLAGCGPNEPVNTSPRAMENGPRPDADNSGRNKRDKDGTTMTPTDQKSNDADLGTTSAIRERIVDADLSTDAENVKVITANGRVTLRGPVNSQAEKDTIDRIARDVAGTGGVDNLLEIVSAR